MSLVATTLETAAVTKRKAMSPMSTAHSPAVILCGPRPIIDATTTSSYSVATTVGRGAEDLVKAVCSLCESRPVLSRLVR